MGEIQKPRQSENKRERKKGTQTNNNKLDLVWRRLSRTSETKHEQHEPGRGFPSLEMQHTRRTANTLDPEAKGGNYEAPGRPSGDKKTCYSCYLISERPLGPIYGGTVSPC
jgi:hypothetical protein